MAIRDKYHPDYRKKYPGVKISPDVMRVLRESDRQLKYMEFDLKLEQFSHDQEKGRATFRPSREDSIERLRDEEDADFPSQDASPEETAIRNDEITRLYRALGMLLPEERALVYALFFEGKTEKELAGRLGLTQQGVSWRLILILRKLKNIME